MEKMKLAFFLFSLAAIAVCFGASVWLYAKGFGWLYMVLFFLALVWQSFVVWNYCRQRRA